MKKIYLFLAMLLGMFGGTALWAQELSKYDYAPDYDNALITDVYQLQSPCSDEAEGSLGALIGQPDAHENDAFWHSDWHGKYTSQHFFQVEIPDDAELTDVLAFVFARRQTDNNHIIKWGVYGTNEDDLELTKEECTLLRICDTPFNGLESELYEVFEHKGFKYIRFYNEGTNSGSIFFHLGSFQLYPTINNSEDEVALQKLLDLYKECENSHYVSGNFVGAIDQSLISAFESAMEEALAKGDDLDATAADLNALYDRLKAAHEACEAAAQDGQFKSGYYYLLNAKDAHNALDESGLKFYMNMREAKKAGWAKMDPDNPTFVWKFTETGEEENGNAFYTMQNFGSGLYIDQYQQSQRNDMIEEGTSSVQVIPFGSGKFYINAPNGSGWQMMHQEDHSTSDQNATGYIVGWNDNAGSASAWYIIRVDDSEIARLEDMKQQLKLDEELSALIDEASIVYSQAFQYECYKDNREEKNLNDPDYVPFTEWELMDGVEDVTPESEYDFYSNSSEAAEHGKTWGSDGVGFYALIDDDLSTDNFYHTSWHGDPQWTAYDEENTEEPAEGALPSNKHNLWMKLKKPVSEVGFVFYPRGNGGQTNGNWDSPRDIDVYVSNDGVNWTLVAQNYDRFNLYKVGYNFKSSPTYGACPAYTGSIPFGGEFEWVRFDVNASRRGKYFNLAELRVVTGMKPVATSQAAQMNEATVKGMQDALAAAKKLEHATPDAISTLQAALGNFRAEFADPSELGKVLKDAKDVLATVEKVESNENEIAGDGIGFYTEGCVNGDELRTAVAEADELLAGTFTKDQLATLESKVGTAAEAAKAALQAGMQQTPDVNTWYQIGYPSYDEYERLGWTVGNGQNDNGNYLFSTVVTAGNNKDEEFYDETEAALNKRMYAMDPELLDNEEYSLFRFIAVGDDTYALQNKGTGLFIHIQHNGPGDNNKISMEPTYFRVQGLGYGKIVLRAPNANPDNSDNVETALHFALSDNDIVGWPAYALNTNSAVELIEKGSASDSDLGNFSIIMREGQAYSYCFPAGIRSTGEGGTMYAVTGRFEEDGETYVSLDEISEAAPGVPFIFWADNEFTEDEFEIWPLFQVTTTTFAAEGQSANGLQGTLTETSVEAGGAVLATDNTNGSYWNYLTNGGSAAAQSAYIPNVESLPETSPSVLCMWVRGLTDGIHSTKATTFKTKDVFTLTGVKVGTTNDMNSLKRGIYIINGRKVIVP